MPPIKTSAAAARVAPESLSPCEGLAFGREEEEIGRNLDLLLSSSTSKGRLSGTRLAAAATSFGRLGGWRLGCLLCLYLVVLCCLLSPTLTNVSYLTVGERRQGQQTDK